MRASDRLTLNLDGLEPRQVGVPIAPGEIVVGEVPERLRPLVILGIHISEEHDAFHDMLEPDDTAAAHTTPEDRKTHMHVHAAAEYLGMVFWEQLRSEIDPLNRFTNLSIRENWSVVVRPEKAGLGDMIQMMILSSD